VLAALAVEEDDGTAADAARRRTSHAVFEPIVLVDRMAMLFDSVLGQSSEILLHGLSQSYSPSFVISEPYLNLKDETAHFALCILWSFYGHLSIAFLVGSSGSH